LVTLFNAPQWLAPMYVLAGWLPKEVLKKHPVQPAPEDGVREREESNAVVWSDVRSAFAFLPLLLPFFVEKSQVLPGHSELYYCVESLTVPTPKGPKCVTRSKVEGDHRAVHLPSHAPPAGSNTPVSQTTVTNSTAYFSLLPGHNQFLLFYEEAAKLRCFNYRQLDMLRFVWVAMRELVDDSKVFHRHDGNITELAKRDLKNNNAASPFALALEENERAKGGESKADAHRKAEPKASTPMVGRGGGNARLNQGTSGNVVTGPSKEVREARQEMLKKVGLKGELEEECKQRWPHTPPHKACLFVTTEVPENEMEASALSELGVVPRPALNHKGTKRRGPLYFFCTVELPFLNKKGAATARFKAARWCGNRRDAENLAAEAALLALRLTKGG
jgi:hypothetical protein